MSCQVGSESFQVDGYDADNSRFSQLYESTYLLKYFDENF